MNFEKWFDENYDKVMDVRIGKESIKKICLIAWQAAQPQWQPIETAPADDLFIGLCSLYTGYSDNENVVTVCDRLQFYNEQNGEFYSFDEEMNEKLLQWQPLPSPPAGSKND